MISFNIFYSHQTFIFYGKRRRKKKNVLLILSSFFSFIYIYLLSLPYFCCDKGGRRENGERREGYREGKEKGRKEKGVRSFFLRERRKEGE